MELKISNLKTEFNEISLVRSKTTSVFETLKNKMDRLKHLYTDYIKHSNNTHLFVFGLDSFHFQNKLIDLEYDDMKRIFLFINNRMYCEYFKLYKLICSYISQNIFDKKILEIIKGNNFPVYKDLEPFKDYKFEITMEIHENILILLNSIIGIVNNKENELSIHKNKQMIGLNINNFVSSFNYEITLMKEKINLFLSYINFFHNLHSKYLKRFNNKLQLILNHINTDIHFDEENIENTNSDDNIDINNDKEIKIVNKSIIRDLSIDINNSVKNQIFDDFESLNTSCNSSVKSVEFNNNTSNEKFKMTKIIKKGLKKVNDIFNGCNNSKYIDNMSIDNKEIVLENVQFNNVNKDLLISLNDFNNLLDHENEENNDYVSEVIEEPVVVEEPVIVEEPVVIEEPVVVEEESVIEEPVVVEEPVVIEKEPVIEEPVVIEKEPVIEEPVVDELIVEESFDNEVISYSNEKETQTEIYTEPVIEEPVVIEEEVIEEPVVVEEPVVIEEEVIEEPVIEEPVVIEEEVIEEPVIVEEPVVIEEEVIEESVIEEPVVIEEEVIEEPVVIEEEVIEEPVVIEEVIEEPVIVEEPVVIEEEVIEEPVIEEPVVIEEEVIEEPVVVEEPVVIEEEVIEEPVVVEEPVVIEEEPVIEE